MELTDGIDFFEWNATVRSLTAAVERLERTVGWLMTGRELPQLIDGVTELNDHLRCFLTSDPPDPLPSLAETLPHSSADQAYDDRKVDHNAGPPETVAAAAPDPDDGDGIPIVGPECEDLEDGLPDREEPAAAYPPRFGDPVAIHLYGGRRRRR